jgi:hypothetical protein
MEEPVDTNITIKATLEKEFEILREAQNQHKEDLEEGLQLYLKKSQQHMSNAFNICMKLWKNSQHF